MIYHAGRSPSRRRCCSRRVPRRGPPATARARTNTPGDINKLSITTYIYIYIYIYDPGERQGGPDPDTPPSSASASYLSNTPKGNGVWGKGVLEPNPIF